MTRYLADDLGLNPRCAALMLLTLAAIITGTLTGWDVFFGIATVASFAAGTNWHRTLHCDNCRTSLEER